MLKNRDITVRIGKKVADDEVADEPKDEIPLEDKVQRVVQVLEKVAVKAFAGVCIYVMFDTIRQVAVAKASNPNE